MVDFFTLLMLVITPGVMIVYVMVIIHWGPTAWATLKSRNMDAQDWLIAGVTVGFMGGLGDIIYWDFAWHFDYTGHAARDWFFTHGSISNVIFRQGFGLVSGLCHIVSSYMLTRDKIGPRMATLLSVCIMFGIGYAVYLLMGHATIVDPTH